MHRHTLAFLFLFIACAWRPSWARDPNLVDREASELLEDGRFLEAMAAFEELTAETNPLPWRAKGHARMGGIMALFLDQMADAERALRRAVALDPKGPIGADAHFQLGMILHEQERYAEAAEEFEAFLSLDAVSVNGPTAEFLLSQCRRLAGRAPPAPKPEPPPSDGFRLSDDTIRVAILKNVGSVVLGCAGPWMCGESPRDSRTLERGKVTVTGEGDELTVGTWRSKAAALTFAASGNELIDVNGMPVPGTVRISATKGKLLVVNVLGIEDYVRGVVPKEMPASWPGSALEAQAVCARTYAVYHKLRRRDYDFDLLSTVSSQVYGGAARDARADSAVARTSGRILLYKGEPALTLFHSSSGGHTEDMDRVWGSGLPYLTAREDPYSPPNEWKLTLRNDETARLLSACGENTTTLRRIEFLNKDPSGRYQQVRIVRADGESVLRSDRFRGCIGPGTMKSTRVTVSAKGDVVALEGTGFGHGVGLSQWGARGMASKGAKVEEILAFYYPGATLGRMVVQRG